jgi:hypothetical protein
MKLKADGVEAGGRKPSAELGVLSLLRGAEKHIPMIDCAADFENRHGAKASGPRGRQLTRASF